MLTLIVNADDYGLSPAVSAGIRKAHQDGIVTSTTVMITTPGAADAIRIAQRETPALGLGLHLTLAGMAAAPVTPADQVRSLVRADGLFYDKPEWSARASDFDADEVAREIEAQFAAFMSAAGCPPTHLDSHYHAAYRLPAALETMYTLAHEYELPIRDPGTPGVNLNRFRTPSAFLSVDRGMDADTLAALIASAGRTDRDGDRVVELMCHPGFVDEALIGRDRMTIEREAEIALLTDPRVRAACQGEGIRLGTFAAVP